MAATFEAALLETVHHHGRIMARTREAPGWTAQFRELVLDVEASLYGLRGPGGKCAGLLYPDRAGNVVQGRHLDYHWDGARVDLYRDAVSGAVFRLSV